MKKFYLIMPFVCMLMMSFKPDGGEEKHQGHEYVDLGLSVKWATCNIGASSPEGYGDYFAFYLYFHGGIRYRSCNLRDNGQSVRPVLE